VALINIVAPKCDVYSGAALFLVKRVQCVVLLNLDCGSVISVLKSQFVIGQKLCSISV